MGDDEKVEGPGVIISFIRWFRGLSQPKLSEMTGIHQSQLSRYESGAETPGTSQRQRIAAAGRVPLRVWDFSQYCLQLIRRAIAAEVAIAAPPAGTDRGDEEIHAAVCNAVDRALALTRADRALLGGAHSGKPSPPTEEDIARADARVETLRRCTEAKRRLLIEGAPTFRDWVVCVRLCAASERAAADDPAEALMLAELALSIAARGPGTDGWLARLAGYCMGFVANSHKTANEFRLAEATFARAWSRWNAGEDERYLLSKAHLLDLEASLRWAQRQFSKALELIEQALAVAQPDEVGFILLNKAAALEQKGDNEGSIEVLKQAAQAIDSRKQPRLFFGARFNLAANLLRLHRAEEAAPIVEEVRKLVNRLGNNELDRVRTRWLEGNLSAGLGRREEAAAALEEVRQALKKLPFDFALASLDLALVYREEGRVAEVQELAVEMVAIFTELEVHREAIAAALLFRDAAARGAVTEGLVRRLQDFLAKARGNRGLRFGG